MVVMDKAIDQEQFERALIILRRLPQKKRERVFKLLGLLQVAESFEEWEEIAKAIAEIIGKAHGTIPPGVQTVNLEDGVPASAKDTVSAYHRRIGDAIRKRREELKLTQEELSEKCGLPQSHISRLEVGKHTPTRATIERVAEALATEPGQLDLLYD